MLLIFFCVFARAIGGVYNENIENVICGLLCVAFFIHLRERGNLSFDFDYWHEHAFIVSYYSFVVPLFIVKQLSCLLDCAECIANWKGHGRHRDTWEITIAWVSLWWIFHVSHLAIPLNIVFSHCTAECSVDSVTFLLHFKCSDLISNNIISN